MASQTAHTQTAPRLENRTSPLMHAPPSSTLRHTPPRPPPVYTAWQEVGKAGILWYGAGARETSREYGEECRCRRNRSSDALRYLHFVLVLRARARTRTRHSSLVARRSRPCRTPRPLAVLSYSSHLFRIKSWVMQRWHSQGHRFPGTPRALGGPPTYNGLDAPLSTWSRM